MKSPKDMTDMELALALDELIKDDLEDPQSYMVSEAAYRLVRADGGPIPPEQVMELDRKITIAYRASLGVTQ